MWCNILSKNAKKSPILKKLTKTQVLTSFQCLTSSKSFQIINSSIVNHFKVFITSKIYTILRFLVSIFRIDDRIFFKAIFPKICIFKSLIHSKNIKNTRKQVFFARELVIEIYRQGNTSKNLKIF